MLFTPRTKKVVFSDTPDRPIEKGFIDGNIEALVRDPLGYSNSVLFPGDLNPADIITAVSHSQMVGSDNKYGLPMWIRTLKILAHENIRFRWVMPGNISRSSRIFFVYD